MKVTCLFTCEFSLYELQISQKKTYKIEGILKDLIALQFCKVFMLREKECFIDKLLTWYDELDFFKKSSL